jgi:hypothetical protein
LPDKVTWELKDAEWPKHFFHTATVDAVDDFNKHEDAAHVFYSTLFSNCGETFRVTIKRTFTAKQVCWQQGI